MKVYIFTVTITVMLIAISFQVYSVNANSTITTLLAWFGPPEDINHDGSVDYLDASSLVYHYGTTDIPSGPGVARWDINRDGSCDYLDASRLVNKYGLYWLV